MYARNLRPLLRDVDIEDDPVDLGDAALLGHYREEPELKFPRLVALRMQSDNAFCGIKTQSGSNVSCQK